MFSNEEKTFRNLIHGARRRSSILDAAVKSLWCKHNFFQIGRVTPCRLLAASNICCTSKRDGNKNKTTSSMFYKTYYGAGHKLTQRLTVSGLQKPSLTHERFISIEIRTDEIMLFGMFSGKKTFVKSNNKSCQGVLEFSGMPKNALECPQILWSVQKYSKNVSFPQHSTLWSITLK